MIEQLKNEIKKLLQQQKVYLSAGNYVELNAINEKIFKLREKLEHEKILEREKINEKIFNEKIYEKISEV